MLFRFLHICCVVCSFLLPFSSLAQAPEILCKQVNDISRAEMRAAEKKQMGQWYKKTASEFLDVKYHRCEWTIDPAVKYISGTVTTYFTLQSASDSVVFDLANNMVVDKVSRKGVDLAFTRGTNTVNIQLGFTLNAGLLDSLSIQYQGAPNSTGFGSFTQTSHSGIPIIWTLSEPYGARDWWPCKNTLDDKIDSVDVFITCPNNKAYKAISNGLRQSERVLADTSKVTTHWKHRYPMVSYLLCLAVTNYQEFNKSVQLGDVTLPMQTFCYPESYDSFFGSTQSTLDAISLFHYTFGEYPFIKEKYGHTQFSWGGGEEHQTNSFVINPGESLCAHELAHQWFGDKITCASWVDIWLNEGFATQLASIFMESRHPESIYSNRKAEIDNITSLPDGSVKVDDTTTVNRIFSNRLTYLKGSHLLYMLRFKLGNDVFLNAIRAYQKDNQLVYNFARTADLKRHLEAASGQRLDSFFRQWYEGQGYPSYNVQWAQIGSATVKIKMSQTTSHPSVPFFQMPVALKFKNALQEKTIVVDNQSNGELFIRDIGFVADSMFIDPEYWLISKNNVSTKVTDIDPKSDNLIVYPSPFRDYFNIMIQNYTGSEVSITLHSAVGQKVFANTYSLYNGREYITVPTQNLATGKYILSVFDAQGERKTISILKD